MTAAGTPAAPIQVDIWSDVVCPWCYIGKRRFERALTGLRAEGRIGADDVQVVWRSFQLDPDAAPRGADEPVRVVDHLAHKYGSGPLEARREQAAQMMDHVDRVAAGEGLHYDQSASLRANTLDAHRVLHAALGHGGPALQSAVKEEFLAGYFTRRQDLGDPAVLRALAAAAGLPEEIGAAVLDGDAFTDEVRADQAQAGALGITGVPFFVLDGRYGVSGAQPVEAFTDVLTRVLGERQAAGTGSPWPGR